MRSLRGRGLLLLVAIGGALAPLLWVAQRTFRIERQTFVPSHHAPQKTPADFAIAGLHAVSFPSRLGYTLRAYYAPSKRGAAVVLAHGAGGERSDLAPETKALSDAGFGVLVFDWPGHGESEGQIRWSDPERQALQGAVDWLVRQPSINPERIGAYGFSMGGYTVTQVAAFDQRLKAVALAGTPHDAIEQTSWEYRRWGFVARWPALLALRLSGMDLATQVPERVIGAIAPRPVLIVSGTEDPTVPPWMSERLLAAAHEPKQLLRVIGAQHGDYAAAAPSTYLAELVAFFSRSLNA